MSRAHLTPGRRQAYLDLLSKKAQILARATLNLAFFDGSIGGPWPIHRPHHPAHIAIGDVLFERLSPTFKIDWDADQHAFAALLESDPRDFGEGDFEVFARAIRKGDTGLGGFPAGPIATPYTPVFDGNFAFRSGWISKLLSHWDDPMNASRPSIWETCTRRSTL